MNKREAMDMFYDCVSDLEKLVYKFNDVVLGICQVSSWIKTIDHGQYWYKCEKCGEKALYDYYGQIIFSDYCPHCGAIMDDEVIEND